MQTTNISKVIVGLLFFTGLLGALILGLDSVLRTGAPMHYYALTFFVIVDFAIGILVAVRSSRGLYAVVIGWSLLRIILQFADVSQAYIYQFSSYAQFVDYLFNPASGLSIGLGNPPGIPALPVDLILVLELAALALAWKARSNITGSRT